MTNLKDIKGFSRYKINEKGEVFRVNSDRISRKMTVSTTKVKHPYGDYEYEQVQLYNDEGKQKKLYIDKLLEDVFGDKEQPPVKPLEEGCECSIKNEQLSVKKDTFTVIDFIVFAMGLIVGHVITKFI